MKIKLLPLYIVSIGNTASIITMESPKSDDNNNNNNSNNNNNKIRYETENKFRNIIMI